MQLEGSKHAEISQVEFRQQPVLDRYRPYIDGYTQEFLLENTGIHSIMVDYHMGLRDHEGNIVEGSSSGKALRPALCLLTADALSKNWEQAVPAAASIELFHNFTLIHDDIQDGDLKRRGKPTVWNLHGMPQGINAGDALREISHLAMYDLLEKGINPEIVLRSSKLLDKTALKVIEGQILDVSFENRLDVTVEEYLAMISRKTGILIENSIMIGALFGPEDSRTTESLRLYGTHIGRAFQISDDILGIWGDTSKMGKDVGADIAHRKKSLPIVMALTSGNNSAKQAMEDIYLQNKPLLDEADINEVLDIMDNLGIQKRVGTILDSSYTSAVSAIQHAQLGWAEKDYLTLANMLSYREK